MLPRAAFGDSKFAEHLCRQTGSFSHQPQQHMLSPDVVMPQLPRFLLS